MITYIIIAITIGAFLLTKENNELKNRYVFNAYAIAHNREWWRFLSHGLLHANFEHLFFNMLSLFFFGPLVESTFCSDEVFGPVKGKINYVMLYIGALIFSSIFTFFKQRDNKYYSALGASGAVSAILFAAILINPISKIYLYGAIPIVAWIYGILFLVYSSYKARKGNDNIGHDAHFWGAVYGFILPVILHQQFLQLFIWQLKAFFLYGGIPQ
jgi:membrane associated rhomboid family serine protease